MKTNRYSQLSRRQFLTAGSTALCGAVGMNSLSSQAAEPIIDLHQHTHYWGRSDEGLIEHQRKLGVKKTVLLPAGSKLGLDADCYGNDSVLALTRKYPKDFVFFANEVADQADAVSVIEKYLKLGAVGIGEQKFFVECDSPHIHRLAELAREYDVPVLLHFQHGKYNTGFERFHKVLEKYPKVNFIGHAQTWWANIDHQHHDQTVLYPKGKVTRGGLTDRWLSDYPNVFGDLSAGSGLNAMTRDEDHAREFLLRHQNKLLFGSDCQDVDTRSEQCVGIRQVALLRRLVTDQKALRKILHRNAQRIIRF